MGIENTARKQRQAIVDRAAASTVQELRLPAQGWIKTVRNALGMSGAELGRRLGLTRARISQAEIAEPSGRITLKAMQAAAEAMGCRFVYAIVPPHGSIEDLIAAQARKKAEALVRRADIHMALEKQSLSETQIQDEIERISRELNRTTPSGLWSED